MPLSKSKASNIVRWICYKRVSYNYGERVMLFWQILNILSANGLCCILTYSNKTTVFHSCTPSESVTIPCNGVTWKNAEGVMNLGNYFLDKAFSGRLELFENFSLHIPFLSLSHEGMYQCDQNSTEWTKHILILTVPPTLSLSWDGDTIVNKTYKGNETDFREEHEKYVEEGEEVELVCLADGAKPQANLTWIINDIPKDGINSKATRNLKENRTFDSNSILTFNATEEKITVICNSSLYESDVETWISATFFTYVTPNTSFEVDGNTVSDTLYLKEGESTNITCRSIGGRPLANITWKTNEDYYELDSDLEEVYALSNGTRVKTFSVTSTIQFIADQVNQIITCKSNIEKANVTKEAYLTVTTCAVPDVSLTVNDDNTSSEVYINKSESVVITCNASGARPEAKLDIIKNGKSMSKAIFSSSKRKNVIDSWKIFTYIPTSNNDTIECVSFLQNCNISKVVKVTILKTDSDVDNEDQPGNFNNVWYIGASVVTFVILLVYCFYNALKRFNASKSTDLSASLQLALSERPVNGVSNVSRELPAIRHSMISTHDETSEISCNEEKLSTVTDVKMIVQLPGEGTIQYWIASGTFQQESNKKIIARCVSESAQMKEHLNFRTLADGLTTLKKHRNITEIVGVSISNVPYYIYTEYFEFGTLRDFLLRNYQQSRDSHTNVAQTLDETAIHLTGFALDVADALMFLTHRDVFKYLLEILFPNVVKRLIEQVN